MVYSNIILKNVIMTLLYPSADTHDSVAFAHDRDIEINIFVVVKYAYHLNGILFIMLFTRVRDPTLIRCESKWKRRKESRCVIISTSDFVRLALN